MKAILYIIVLMLILLQKHGKIFLKWIDLLSLGVLCVYLKMFQRSRSSSTLWKWETKVSWAQWCPVGIRNVLVTSFLLLTTQFSATYL